MCVAGTILVPRTWSRHSTSCCGFRWWYWFSVLYNMGDWCKWSRNAESHRLLEHPATAYGEGLEVIGQLSRKTPWMVFTPGSKQGFPQSLHVAKGMCLLFPHAFVLRNRSKLFLDLIGELLESGWEKTFKLTHGLRKERTSYSPTASHEVWGCLQEKDKFLDFAMLLLSLWHILGLWVVLYLFSWEEQTTWFFLQNPEIPPMTRRLEGNRSFTRIKLGKGSKIWISNYRKMPFIVLSWR